MLLHSVVVFHGDVVCCCLIRYTNIDNTVCCFVFSKFKVLVLRIGFGGESGMWNNWNTYANLTKATYLEVRQGLEGLCCN